MTVGIVVNSAGNLVFTPSFIREDYLGNTPAPKGRYVLDAFFQRRTLMSGVAGLPDVVINTRPAAVEFLQGRLFYSTPVHSEQISGLLYSQQLVDKAKAALDESIGEPLTITPASAFVPWSR